MSHEKVNIKELNVSAYTIPTEDEIESDGTIEWSSTTLVLVELKAGNYSGIRYSYADISSAFFIEKRLKKIVSGKNALDIPWISKAMTDSVRNNGNCGITSMAISVVNNALWDLKAKLFGYPLVALPGKVRKDFSIYGSSGGGFPSYSIDKLQKQLGGWAEQGIKQVKMKIGTEPGKDVERVKKARAAMGETTALFVDANSAYDAKTALEMAVKFSESDMIWFEEPVPSYDLKGLHLVRDHAPAQINIAAGEYGYNLPYFEQMLDSKAVDVLQADAARCGGIPTFLKAGNVCESYHLPFSSHCAPHLHLQPALSLPSFFTAEYFYDHVRIEKMLFDGIRQQENGALDTDMGRSGLGLEFNYKYAEKYKVWKPFSG